MGRGDLRSKKGKISNGSYGKKRKHKVKSEGVVDSPAAKKSKSADVEAPVKKTKKTTKKTKDASTEE